MKRAHKLGYDFDGSSSASLQKSFNSVQDPDVVVCLELLKKKSMQRSVCRHCNLLKTNTSARDTFVPACSISLNIRTGHSTRRSTRTSRLPFAAMQMSSFIACWMRVWRVVSGQNSANNANPDAQPIQTTSNSTWIATLWRNAPNSAT